MTDVTITFVCSHYPGKMLKILKKERKIEAEQVEKGIYKLKNDPIAMQILVTWQLSAEENRWLTSLTRNLPMNENTEKLLREYQQNKESVLYQSAMDLIMQANKGIMEEDGSMVCDVLKEIFADEWKEKELQMQEKESQMQEKESWLQEKENQMQERESQIQEREILLQQEEADSKRRIEKRENRLNSLIQLLLHDNLMDDLRKISEDRGYLEQMCQRYGL